MKHLRRGAVALCLFPLFLLAIAFGAEPIRLHPENPHYFHYRGKAAVLVTSGEHYGAVLNLDFDYVRYLETLAKDGLNHTRLFSGTYHEVPGDFGIVKNTLAPEPDRFICPWPRSDQPGAGDGLNKFDLSRWNEAYFTRLADFVRQASKRGVVVELNLFCPYYRDHMWDVAPLNAKNNINGIGARNRTDVFTMKDGRMQALQDELVRRIVHDLRDFGNLYYEICNEPYFAGPTLEWQKHIAEAIAEAEASFPARHLISQNIANGSQKVENPNPLISIFNFHYSRPPDSVSMNYHLNKAIGINETGFDGTGDAPYRIQGWDFLIAGGALYNNLDYSFVAGYENGTFDDKHAGGGGPVLRRQLGVLLDFIGSYDFVRMRPAPEVVSGALPEGASVRVLAEAGKAYAIYVHHGRAVKDAARGSARFPIESGPQEAQLTLDLPAGSYVAEWVDTKTGRIGRREKFQHGGGNRSLKSFPYTEDVALRIKRPPV